LQRHLIVLLYPLLLLCACQAPLSDAVRRVRLAGEGQLVLYLQPLPAALEGIRFELAACMALSADGQEYPLALALPAVSAAEGGRQRLVAAGTLPAGSYRGLALTVPRATRSLKRGDVDLLVPDAAVIIDFPFAVGRGAGCLIALSIDAAASFPEPVTFVPRFLATVPELPPLGQVGYVSNQGDQTLTVYDKKLGEARALIALEAHPAGMALDVRSRRLYVALPDRDAIQVIDMLTSELRETINLNVGDAPRELALTADGAILLAVNRGSRTLSFIDPQGYLETDRVVVGNQPGRLLIDPAGIRAYVVSEYDNTVAVVDLPRRRVAALLSTESGPLQVALSRDGRRLFIVHSWSPYLLVYDAATLSRRRSVHVGMGASAIKVDQHNDQLYVARRNDPVIDVFDTFSYLPGSSLEADGGVLGLAIDGEESSLVVLLPKERRLQMLNLVSRKSVLRIDVGAEPFQAVQAGER
jgi:YVTN family beta-propeller protein